MNADMMHKTRIAAALLILTLGLAAFTQPGGDKKKKKKEKKGKAFTLAFYNVENLFDTQDDPAIDDQEFLPEGKNKWDGAKLNTKLKNLSQVIAQLGDEDGPEMIGLAEIENEEVLKQLATHPSLKKHGYAWVHHNSPDERGIDVALLYKKKSFFPLYTHAYPVQLPGDDKTRDVLLVKGLVGKDHELTVIVNHWPSRSGGQAESDPDRRAAATVVRTIVDSIGAIDPFAAVVIVGDFNDDPKDPSMHQVLKAGKDTLEAKGTLLYNPMFALHNPDNYGSLMYRMKWNLFDQVIVNKTLLAADSPVRYVFGSAAVYHPDWMAEKEGDYKGAPLRSYLKGEFHPEGYSDHFPVYIQLKY